MQADPPSPPAPVTVNVTPPSIDFGGIGKALVDAVQNALPDLVGGIGQAANSNARSAMDGFWSAVWSSDANVLRTPDIFGPVSGYLQEAQLAAYGIVLLGVVLLGFRTMLSSILPTKADTLGELVYGIATAMILAGALPVLMVRAVDVLNLAVRQVGSVNLTSSLPRGFGGDPITGLALALLVLWFGIKFVLKSMKRLVVLTVLTPFGPIAMLLRCVPSTRWVSGWWARTWGGLLVAQLPAVLALAIGVQMAVFSGVLGVLWTVGFLGAASDLLDLFGYGLLGGSGPGLAQTAMTAARLATGFGGAAAVGAVAASGSADLGGISAAQAAENYGYQ